MWLAGAVVQLGKGLAGLGALSPQPRAHFGKTRRSARTALRQCAAPIATASQGRDPGVPSRSQAAARYAGSERTAPCCTVAEDLYASEKLHSSPCACRLQERRF